MTATVNDWVGSTLAAGRYRVTAKLGEGGMGFVYEAWDKNLERKVVIKVPRASMMDDPEFAPRFAQEVRSLVRLKHRHIVEVYDQGAHDGLPFAVMEYLSGGSLENQRPLDGDGRPLPLSPAVLAAWLPKVAEALDFIHGQGYVHRDVKPANILFDAHGNAYLSDFGVAKALAASGESARAKSLTGTGMVLGTPHYMAPELIKGQPFDGRIDQYALAVTVHVLLSGRPPIDGPTDLAVLVQHTEQPPPSLDALVPSVSPELAAAVLRGLAKQPGERFATCAEFARVALQTVNGPPLATAPPLRSPPGRSAIPIAIPVMPTGHIAETMVTASIVTDAQGVLSRVSKSRGFAQLAIAVIRANWRRRGPARWAVLAGMLLISALLVLAFWSLPAQSLPPIKPETPERPGTKAINPATSPGGTKVQELINELRSLTDAFETRLNPSSAAIIAHGNYGSRAKFEELLDDASQVLRSELEPEIKGIEGKLKELDKTLDEFKRDRKTTDHYDLDAKRLAKETPTHDADEPGFNSTSAAMKADSQTKTRARNEKVLDWEEEFDRLRSALADHPAEAGLGKLPEMISALNVALDNLTYKDADAVQELDALAEIDEAVGLAGRTEFSAHTLHRAKRYVARGKPKDLAFRAFCALVRAADRQAIENLIKTNLRSDFDNEWQRVELCRAAFASGHPEALAQVVVEIVRNDWTDGYTIVDDILLRDPELPFDQLRNDDLRRCLQASRPTAIALARHFVQSGTLEHVEWAIDVFRYADEFSETDLRERLELRQRDNVRTKVLGHLLRGDSEAKVLDSAEWLLAQPEQIRVDELNVAQIGDAALDRKALKGKLFACLCEAGPEARRWVLNKALGADFCKRFADVQAAHHAQRKLIDLASGIDVPPGRSRGFFKRTNEQLLKSEGAGTCRRDDWLTDAKELKGIVTNGGDGMLPEQPRAALLSFVALVVDEAGNCRLLLDTVSGGADLENKNSEEANVGEWKKWQRIKIEFQRNVNKCQKLVAKIEQLESSLRGIKEDAVVPPMRARSVPWPRDDGGGMVGNKRKGRPE